MNPSKCKRFERLIYGEGQLLLAADLQAEQDYFRQKIQLQNRNLFGACVVQGFGVNKVGDSYVVTPGIAYDCKGRELIADETTTVDISEVDTDGIYVLLEFREFPTAHRASSAVPEDSQPSRVIEGVRAYTGYSSLPSTHERTSRGWKACNSCEAIPIALLRDGNVERIIPDESD